MVSSSVAHGWRGGCFSCCLMVRAGSQHPGTAGGRKLLAEQSAVSGELREPRAETPRALRSRAQNPTGCVTVLIPAFPPPTLPG